MKSFRKILKIVQLFLDPLLPSNLLKVNLDEICYYIIDKNESRWPGSYPALSMIKNHLKIYCTIGTPPIITTSQSNANPIWRWKFRGINSSSSIGIFENSNFLCWFLETERDSCKVFKKINGGWNQEKISGFWFLQNIILKMVS